MESKRVLVAFSSPSGSTACAAELIASVLRSAGLAVDCRPTGEVADLAGYEALVLGSGVFVPRRASDGGGFLERQAAALRVIPVWLFCMGPIGGGGSRADGAAGSTPAEGRAAAVAQAIGARGVATFGTLGMPDGEDPVALLHPADAHEIRAWAATIAEALQARDSPAHRTHHRGHGSHGVSLAS
jgi:menaquinone-dependent protoporphyrinogen oxidase